MTVPSYTSDVATLLLEMSSTTGWTALGGGASGLVAPETDFFIQGANCISKAAWTAATKGMIYAMGAGQTIPSGKAVFMWLYYTCPNSLAAEASGGIQLLIGSSASAFKRWYVKGSDTYTYGGWFCAVVDPTITADATTGSPSATLQYFGGQVYLPSGGPSRGQPFGIDAFRYGREFYSEFGETANYATFAGAAAYNDDISRRYGQFQVIDGAYLMQGAFVMGTATNAVDFRDSNRNILIANTKKVTSTFNLFEIRNASSRVDWNTISISALGTTSRGDLTVTNNADVNFDNCVFTDLGDFSFQSNSTINTSTFRRCGLITQNTAILNNCTVDSARGSVAILSNSPNYISNSSFISDGTGHAIEMTTSGIYAFSGNTFTGYGSTGTTNAAVYNNSGGAVTLNISGGDSPTYYNGAGASTTVNSTINVTLTGLTNPTEVRVYIVDTTTEIAGQENVTTGTFMFSYSASSSVDIRIFSVGYLPADILSFTIPTVNTTLPIQQIFDRVYSNP